MLEQDQGQDAAEQEPADTGRKIPIGVLLILVGFCVICSAVTVVFILPSTAAIADQLTNAESIAYVDLYEEGTPVPRETRVLPTPAELPDSFPLGSSLAILPDSNVEAYNLPSVASVEEAPTDFDITDPEQPVRLVIPSLDIDVAIQKVGIREVIRDEQRYLQWQVPDGYAVGWHLTTATLGHTGNTVLNGHNNVHGSVFKDLIDLQKGETIIVHDTTSVHEYRVVEQKLLPENGQPQSVRYSNARWIGPSGDERITLVSCWPFSTNENRLIVVARPVQKSGS